MEVSTAVAAAAAQAAQEKKAAAVEGEAKGLAMGRVEAASGVSKILRLLHVAGRFEAKGDRLPTAVDFFSKVWNDGDSKDGCIRQGFYEALVKDKVCSCRKDYAIVHHTEWEADVLPILLESRQRKS